MVIRLRWLLLLGSFGLAACAGQQRPAHTKVGEFDDRDVITAAVGDVTILDLDFMAAPNPLIGDVAIVTVQAGGNPRQLRMIPLRKGTTEILVISEDGRASRRITYNAIPADLPEKLRSVRQLLSGIPGLSIALMDRRIVVDGRLANPDTVISDLDRILRVQEGYKDVLFNLVEISPELYETSRQRMEKDVRSIEGCAGVNVEFINGTFVLSGTVRGPAERDRATKAVELVLPPAMGSVSVRDNALSLGTRKYSIVNLVQVLDGKVNRMPASVPPIR